MFNASAGRISTAAGRIALFSCEFSYCIFGRIVVEWAHPNYTARCFGGGFRLGCAKR